MSNSAYIKKKKGHLNHITLAFHGLKEKYHLLEPMLFDKKLAQKHNNHGFVVIRQSLFFSCVIDIVNIVKKGNKNPSIQEISDIFDSKEIMKTLHDDIVYFEAFKGIKRLEEQQSVAFQKNVKITSELVKKFLELDKYKSSLSIRDKRIAHLELKEKHGEYELLDISTLGLQWGDLKEIIYKLEIIIVNLNIILTGVNIAKRDAYCEKIKNEYWY